MIVAQTGNLGRLQSATFQTEGGIDVDLQG